LNILWKYFNPKGPMFLQIYLAYIFALCWNEIYLAYIFALCWIANGTFSLSNCLQFVPQFLIIYFQGLGWNWYIGVMGGCGLNCTVLDFWQTSVVFRFIWKVPLTPVLHGSVVTVIHIKLAVFLYVCIDTYPWPRPRL
jgi:hypothetical protein